MDKHMGEPGNPDTSYNFFYTFPLGLSSYLPGTTALRTGCAKQHNIEDCLDFEL